MPTHDGGEVLTALPTPPSRVQQVYDAIVDDICTGRIAPGTPLRQELLVDPTSTIGALEVRCGEYITRRFHDITTQKTTPSNAAAPDM